MNSANQKSQILKLRLSYWHELGIERPLTFLCKRIMCTKTILRKFLLEQWHEFGHFHIFEGWLQQNQWSDCISRFPEVVVHMFLKDVSSKTFIFNSKLFLKAGGLEVAFLMVLKEVSSETSDPQRILKDVSSETFILGPQLFLKTGGLEVPFPMVLKDVIWDPTNVEGCL